MKKRDLPYLFTSFGTMVEVLPNSWPGEGQKQPLFAAVRCWSCCAALQPRERGEPCYLHKLWTTFPCLGRAASWLASPVRVWKSRGFLTLMLTLNQLASEMLCVDVCEPVPHLCF